MDVFAEEPMSPSPLWKVENTRIFPVAGFTTFSFLVDIDLFGQNINYYITG